MRSLGPELVGVEGKVPSELEEALDVELLEARMFTAAVAGRTALVAD